MPHFMIVLFITPFLDNKMSIFEEYGAFNILLDILGIVMRKKSP